MGVKKTRMRELTKDDMVGVNSTGNKFMIDFLRDVTKRAAEIFDNEVDDQAQDDGLEEEKEEEDDVKATTSSSSSWKEYKVAVREITWSENLSSKKRTVIGQNDKEELRGKRGFRNPPVSETKLRNSVRNNVKLVIKSGIVRTWEEESAKNHDVTEASWVENLGRYRMFENRGRGKEKQALNPEEEFPRKENLDDNNLTTENGETSGAENRKRKRSTKGPSWEEERQVFKERKKVYHGPEPPLPLPEEFGNAILEVAAGRSVLKVVLVVQKGLYKSDLDQRQSRLSIPINSLKGDFLTDAEKETLESRRSDGKVEHINVQIIDPMLVKFNIDLRRWEMNKESGNKSISYMLTGSWLKIAKNNKFVVGTVLQLWAARMDNNDLCFCLVRLPGK